LPVQAEIERVKEQYQNVHGYANSFLFKEDLMAKYTSDLLFRY